MRKVKKLLGLLLAAVMVLAMGVPTFAANEFTITAPDNEHTYEIYQVFTGDYSEGILSNVKWGKNGTGTPGAAVEQTVLNALTAVNSASDKAQLDVIEDYVKLDSDDAFGTVGKGSAQSLTVPGGYYLIKDKDDSVSGNDSYTPYIVKVVGNVTIAPKSDVPEFEKKVQDINDSTDTTVSDWQDTADHDIGDKVNFLLKGTVADNYDNYDTYKFVFHDQESAGLTFQSSSVVVKVGDTKIDSSYYSVVTSELSDGCTCEIRFDDLKKIEDAEGNKLVYAGADITVEYQSVLNENAVIGSAGNPNTAHLEFSNNPNDEQGGETGTTPDDTVIVFTFKTIINKVKPVDGEEGKTEPLAGAAFKLEKLIKGTEGAEDTWELIKEFTADENTTKFEFSGLDDGQYRLTETATPDGYNTMSPNPFEFTITATHDDETLTLTGLNGKVITGEVELTFAANSADGSLSANVVNQKGSTLPETGGMGTTIFYVLGAILVLGAGGLLIARRHTDSDK